MKKIKFKIGYATGVFDVLHEGHKQLLKNAKKHCEFLIVGVSSDELVEAYKGIKPVVKLSDRIKEVEQLEYVDKVVVQYDLDKSKSYDKLKFDVVFHGDDLKADKVWNRYVENLKKINIPVVFLPYSKSVSSSKLKNNANDFIYEKKDDEYIIKKYVGSSDIVVIPNAYNGLKIVAIGDAAFAFSDVKKVYMSESIRYIGSECFYCCKNLELVNCNLLKKTGIGSFAECSNLTTVVLPEDYSVINKQLFYNCTRLKNINLGKNIERICLDAFFGCKSLVKENKGVILIDTWIIKSLKKLKKVVLPKNSIGIADAAFVDDKTIEKITISDSVRHIGMFAFDGSGIWNNTSNNSLVYADRWVVGTKGKITKCILNDETIGVADLSFGGLIDLQSVTFNSNIKYIGQYAFRSCVNLCEVNNLTEKAIVDKTAFLECYRLNKYEVV